MSEKAIVTNEDARVSYIYIYYKRNRKKKSDFTCQDVANRHFDSAMKCTACTFLAKYLRTVSMQISSMNFILPNNTSERVYSGNPDG